MTDFNDYAHIGPDTLAGKFLRTFWQPVMLSDELAPGRPQRLQILNQHYTAFRGEGGEAHIVQDACPHRSTRLHLGWVEGEAIRCFYHGWTYDGATGECIDMPAESDNFRSKVCIRAYPVREYLGFVFAYLGEGEAPPFPLYPEVDVEADTVFFNKHPVPCNFYQRIENDLDELHLHFVHRVSTDEIGLVEIPEIDVTETEYGIRRIGHRKEEGHNVTRKAHIFMPNTLMTFTPGRPSRPQWMLHLAWRVPVDDETMMSFIVSAQKGGGAGLKPRGHVEPDPNVLTEEVLAGRLRVQDLDPDYPGLFNVQDNVALAGQGAIVDRTQERLGQSDKGVIFMRRLWAREMQNIADGKPLKQWRRPAESLLDYASREVELAVG